MFINNMMSYISEGTKIALYADVAKIWCEIIDWNDHLALQNDINSLFHWSCVNKMSFHPQKCEVLSVAKKKYEPLL